jgi:signal transduction histidine kinase
MAQLFSPSVANADQSHQAHRLPGGRPVSSAEKHRSTRRGPSAGHRWRIRLIVGALGLTLLALTAALWDFSHLSLDRSLQEAGEQRARLTVERLDRYFQTRLATLKHVGQFYIQSESTLGQRQGDTEFRRRLQPDDRAAADPGARLVNESEFQSEFQKYCRAAIAQTPGILAVVQADTDGIPVWIAPEPSRLSRQDVYWLTTDPRFISALGASTVSSRPVFTEPMNLPMHGEGLLAAVPLVIRDRHLGFIVGILPFQDLLRELSPGEQQENFRLQIRTAGRAVYPPEGDPAVHIERAALWTEAAAGMSVAIGDREWTVHVTPLRAGRYSPFNFVSMTIAVLGLCLALIATFLVHRMLWRSACLQSEAFDQLSRLERTDISLMEVRTQLDLILNSVDEGVVLYDDKLEPVQANAAFLAMFQMTEKGMTSAGAARHHDDMVRLLGRETRYWAMFEALKRDPARAYSDEIDTPLPKDNKIRRPRYFLRRAVAATDARDAMSGVLVIYKDVSTLKDIERVKDEFLSNVTHELRSPLASIKGFAEMIRRDPAMQEETREEFVSIICEESARLQHLIEELLDLRRLQSQGMPLRVVPLELKALVDDVVRGAHSVAHAKNIRFEVRWDGLDNTRMSGDVSQLGRALRNLLVNAVKYSPPGGTIAVQGHGGLQRVSLEISDQGTGIDEKELPYIFDQFYRGSSRGRQKGTGLGLAIVKHTIELHGGHLGVRSEVGHGTSFRVELPRIFKPTDTVAVGGNGAATTPTSAARPTQPAEPAKT